MTPAYHDKWGHLAFVEAKMQRQCLKCGSPCMLERHHVRYKHHDNNGKKEIIVDLCNYCHKEITKINNSYIKVLGLKGIKKERLGFVREILFNEYMHSKERNTEAIIWNAFKNNYSKFKCLNIL